MKMETRKTGSFVFSLYGGASGKDVREGKGFLQVSLRSISGTVFVSFIVDWENLCKLSRSGVPPQNQQERGEIYAGK